MIVKINLDAMEISTVKNTIKCETVKEFKDNVSRIIKGKACKKTVPVQKWISAERAVTRNEMRTVYTKYDIEEIQFYTKSSLYAKKLYDGKLTNYPTTGTVNWTAIQLFGMCLANNIYATVYDSTGHSHKVDSELLDMIQDVRECEQIDKMNHNNIFRLVSAITSSGNSQLIGLYLSCMVDKTYLDIERFCFELQASINKSGYDVAMSSDTYIEGRLTYKFYDGSQMVQGCKTATTKYVKYTTLAIDLVNMFLNIKFYESVGLEPELTQQRHTTIGLANSWRFTDDDELEKFIESEMKDGDIDLYEEQTHHYNASVEMLFN